MSENCTFCFYLCCPSQTSPYFSFIVNTRIDMPHADQITSLALCPNQNDPDLPPIAVTCSLDKTFKIWELHTAQSSMQDSKSLRLRVGCMKVKKPFTPFLSSNNNSPLVMQICWILQRLSCALCRLLIRWIHLGRGIWPSTDLVEPVP